MCFSISPFQQDYIFISNKCKGFDLNAIFALIVDVI